MKAILGTWLVLVFQYLDPVAEAQADDATPVQRVVTLLGELQARAQADLAADQQVYDRLACWCEENTAKQAAEITEARSNMERLGMTILELKGGIATLVSEVKDLQTGIAENIQAQDTATSIREKENSEFMAEKAEMEQALAALEKAIFVLKGAMPESLAQQGPKALRRSTGLTQLASWPSALAKAKEASLSAAQRMKAEVAFRQLSSLTQVQDRLDYAPQSATIQGILQDMYRTFASSLEQRTHEEAKAHETFEDFIASKKKALKTLEESLEKKKTKKVEAELMLADADIEYEHAQKELKAKIELFDSTKSSCSARTQEWATRKKLHDELLAGLAEALAILTSDDARSVFDQAYNVTFLQVSSASFHAPATAQQRLLPDEAVSKATQTLQAHARSSQSLRLAGLAAEVRQKAHAKSSSSAVGHFDEVISSIEDVIAELRREQANDDRSKDECTENLHESQQNVEHYDWKVAVGTSKYQKLLQAAIDESSELDSTTKQMAAMEQAEKDMQAQRTQENSRFLEEKDNDLKAIALLKQAQSALARFYSERGMPLRTSLLSRAQAEKLPEANFTKPSDRRVQSQGIVSLLAVIIEDLQSEIDSDVAAEEAAQLDFEKQLAAVQTLIKNLGDRATDLEDSVATLNTQADTADTNVKDDQKELGKWQNLQEGLQPQCDWILAHADERRRKREVEMEGLRQAKEYLAGAQPGMAATFLVRPPK